jgi:hypothetical protein
MLPYLQPKKLAATIMAKMSKDSPKTESVEGEQKPELITACESIISAISTKDATRLADAIKSAIEACRD